MFKKHNPEEEDHETTFDEVITGGLDQINTYDVFSEEYTTGVDNIHKLAEAKSLSDSKKLGLDAVVGSATTLATALLVLNFEKTGIIVSKAFSLIPKVRL